MGNKGPMCKWRSRAPWRVWLGYWVGEKGEIYEIHFTSTSVGFCRRTDQSGAKTFKLRWDRDSSSVLWGSRYFLKVSDVQSKPQRAVWNNVQATSGPKGRSYVWQRA